MRIEDVNAKIKRYARGRLSETRTHALYGEGKNPIQLPARLKGVFHRYRGMQFPLQALSERLCLLMKGAENELFRNHQKRAG